MKIMIADMIMIAIIALASIWIAALIWIGGRDAARINAAIREMDEQDLKER